MSMEQWHPVTGQHCIMQSCSVSPKLHTHPNLTRAGDLHTMKGSCGKRRALDRNGRRHSFLFLQFTII